VQEPSPHRRAACCSHGHVARKGRAGGSPQILHICVCSRQRLAKFLIIGRRFRARDFPKSLIVRRCRDQQPRPKPRAARNLTTPSRGRGGEQLFPQISHSSTCARWRLRTLFNDYSDLDRASFFQISHSSCVFRPLDASGRPASPGISPLATPAGAGQGRGLRPPQISHISVCRRAGSRTVTIPQISHSSSLVHFRINNRRAGLLPKNLIIAPQISHFIPQIIHSYPESFPKNLIAPPKSFIVRLINI
jgi:hypothetical protein